MSIKSLYITLILNLFITGYSFSQDELSDSTKLEEIVISANKVLERRANIAQQINVISKDYIISQSPLNSADLLQSTGEIFVQKSQQGGGSPVIRGFEASRILLVVDGVRMNNLIYRSGHLQNLITIDPNVLDKVEILNGPGSTVYGSDALGGVIHFRTKNPVLSSDGKINLFGSVSSSFHSVNKGQNLNFALNTGSRRFASFSAVTLTRFGDLKMGGTKNTYNDKGYFGERPVYAERINGKDTLVTNSNKLIQKFSGYDQIDILQKFLFKPSENTEHTINLQYSNSTNVHRYDRLTDVKGAGLNSSEWYYGPQKRVLAIYNFKLTTKSFFETFEITGNIQSVQESRHNRGFGSTTLNHRIEDVSIAGLQFSANHNSGKNSLRTGIDIFWNEVKSTAYKENIITKVESPLDTRYPDGKNRLLNGATYATHTLRINKNFVMNDGIRLGFNSLSSTFVNKTFFPFPFNDVKQNNFVYSGNFGLIYNNNGIKASYMVSVGFRTPNVDDLSKVFESIPGRIIVPNPNLKPESTLTNEISLGYFDKTWSFENVAYYTSLINFLSLAAGTFEGKSTILYNGVQSQVFNTINRAEGYIYGFNTNIRKILNYHWLVYGTLSYTYGRSKDDGKVSPLDHISPIILKMGVEAKFDNLDGAFYMIANGKKDVKNYGPSGEDNIQYAPSTGMPGWMTLNLKTGYKVSEAIKFQAGVENIMDIQHRYFASGINAPGRNLWLSARISF